MLFTINRARVPGVIEAALGDVSKRVYVRDGYIIHASSTDRAFFLVSAPSHRAGSGFPKFYLEFCYVDKLP